MRVRVFIYYNVYGIIEFIITYDQEGFYEG